MKSSGHFVSWSCGQTCRAPKSLFGKMRCMHAACSCCYGAYVLPWTTTCCSVVVSSCLCAAVCPKNQFWSTRFQGCFARLNFARCGACHSPAGVLGVTGDVLPYVAAASPPAAAIFVTNRAVKGALLLFMGCLTTIAHVAVTEPIENRKCPGCKQRGPNAMLAAVGAVKIICS